MKKLLILCAAFLLMTVASIAQTPDQTPPSKTDKHHKMKDCVMMKDGKMWVMKDGQKSEMTETMTLSNGTSVMTDGSVKTTDGKTMMMKDGDMMDMNGKMKSKKMDKKM